MNPYIYIKAPENTSLEAFSAFMKDSLPIQNWHERESSNYYKGTYWLGSLEDKEIKLCWLDSKGFEDYTFWVIVKQKKNEPADEEYVDSIAQFIAQKGFSTFIPEDDISDKGNLNGLKYENRA